MIRRLFAFAAAAAVVATSSAALAHHGWGFYDAEKPLRVVAPLTSISWGNPHGAAKIVHRGRSWDVILPPMRRLEERSRIHEMLKSGGPVTLVGYPRKDGTAEMRMRTLIVKGKTVCDGGLCGSLATSRRAG